MGILYACLMCIHVGMFRRHDMFPVYFTGVPITTYLNAALVVSVHRWNTILLSKAMY